MTFTAGLGGASVPEVGLDLGGDPVGGGEREADLPREDRPESPLGVEDLRRPRVIGLVAGEDHAGDVDRVEVEAVRHLLHVSGGLFDIPAEPLALHLLVIVVGDVPLEDRELAVGPLQDRVLDVVEEVRTGEAEREDPAASQGRLRRGGGTLMWI